MIQKPSNKRKREVQDRINAKTRERYYKRKHQVLTEWESMIDQAIQDLFTSQVSYDKE